jgi:diacylglycerol kinase (ATP)
VLGVWGGDGTYNEAARGLVGSETALLALPGGTTSVLAYELGIPRDPERALVGQLAGERRSMAVGRTDAGQLFLLMVSAGPDAVILTNLPPFLKLRGGKAGITAQAVLEFVRGNLPRFAVAINGDRVEASWCIVGNARSYAGPYAATPGADPFVSGLEVVTLTRHGRTALVPFFFSIPSGRHLRMRGVTRCAAREVRFEGGEGIPYQLDGDPAGFLPVTARASDERLWVMLPRPAAR